MWHDGGIPYLRGQVLPRAVIPGLLLVALGLGGLWLGLQTVVQGELERAAARATGSDLSIASIRPVPTLDGFTITGLDLANPPGFGGGDLLQIRQLNIRLHRASLLRGTLEIRSLEAVEPRLHLRQRRGRLNLITLLDSVADLRRHAPATGDQGRLIAIAALHAEAPGLVTDLGPAYGRAGQREVPLPDLVRAFETNGSIATTGDHWVADVVVLLAEHVLEVAPVELPTDVRAALARELAGLRATGE